MTTELLLETLTPADLGFDHEQYSEYRRAQLEALELAAYSESRFVGHEPPRDGLKPRFQVPQWKV